MFESLSDRLQGVLKGLRGRGKLSEADVDAALREVRLALFEADVSFKVVRSFLKALRERAIGAEVMESLTPGQQVVKIVHEELISLLGDPVPLTLTGSPPHVIMLVGLQGSGKTTAAGKLALALRKQGQRCLLAAADIYRPAAIEQLQTIGKQIDVPVHALGTTQPPTIIAKTAVERARKERLNTVIVDTAGRLQIDTDMMAEIQEIAADRFTPRGIARCRCDDGSRSRQRGTGIPRPGAAHGTNPHEDRRRRARRRSAVRTECDRHTD